MINIALGISPGPETILEVDPTLDHTGQTPVVAGIAAETIMSVEITATEDLIMPALEDTDHPAGAETNPLTGAETSLELNPQDPIAKFPLMLHPLLQFLVISVARQAMFGKNASRSQKWCRKLQQLETKDKNRIFSWGTSRKHQPPCTPLTNSSSSLTLYSIL
jgi:hypothetical protein